MRSAGCCLCLCLCFSASAAVRVPVSAVYFCLCRQTCLRLSVVCLCQKLTTQTDNTNRQQVRKIDNTNRHHKQTTFNILSVSMVWSPFPPPSPHTQLCVILCAPRVYINPPPHHLVRICKWVFVDVREWRVGFF